MQLHSAKIIVMLDAYLSAVVVVLGFSEKDLTL